MKWRSQPLTCPFSADAAALARPRTCLPSARTDDGNGHPFGGFTARALPLGTRLRFCLCRDVYSSDLDSKNKCESKHTDKIHTNASLATRVPYLLSLITKHASWPPPSHEIEFRSLLPVVSRSHNVTLDPPSLRDHALGVHFTVPQSQKVNMSEILLAPLAVTPCNLQTPHARSRGIRDKMQKRVIETRAGY